MKTKKGFTLLELLIVIGILAILSTTVVLVINPAQLLKKARDSQRISDLSTLKTAIAYYITETASPSIGEAAKSYSDVAGNLCFGTISSATSTTVGSGGWIPIPFDEMAGGSPIGSLPRDPNQSTVTGDYYYSYGANADFTFKLVANMESTYYSAAGTTGVEDTDGGTEVTLYEVGTDMSRTIIVAGDTCYPNR